jgi:hypothetical protein
VGSIGAQKGAEDEGRRRGGFLGVRARGSAVVCEEDGTDGAGPWRRGTGAREGETVRR